MANLDQHIRGPLMALPQTFSDAVSVTKVLGVRYLWSDSLCIVQDSEHDWHAEVSAMADIYENALLTICADAATNATEGFLGPPARSFQPATAVSYKYAEANGQVFHGTVQVRPRGKLGLMLPYHDTWEVPGSTAPDLSAAQPRGTVPAPLLPNLLPTSPDPRFPRRYANITTFSQADEAAAKHGDVDDSAVPRSKLSTRGWVFQERVLAPRTLHFSRSEVTWECRSLCTCECSANSNRPRMVASLLKQCLANWGMKVDERWRKEIVQEYSCLDLTVQTDRLLALSGLAGRLSRLRPDDTYAVGLWESSLPRDLLWYTRPSRHSERLMPYCAPTWSWVSVTGSTAYTWDNEIDGISPTLQIVSINVKPASTTNLYGNAQEGAYLVIKGISLRTLLRHAGSAGRTITTLDIVAGADRHESEFEPVWDTSTGGVDSNSDREFVLLLMTESRRQPCGILLSKSGSIVSEDHRSEAVNQPEAYERIAYVGHRRSNFPRILRRGSYGGRERERMRQQVLDARQRPRMTLQSGRLWGMCGS